MKDKLFIDGHWLSPVLDGTLSIINPTDETLLQLAPAATQEDVDMAVAAAKRAFKTWGRTTGATRAKFLREIANGVRARREELARLETLNNGKPLPEALWDMDDVAGCFDYYAGLAEGLDAKQNTKVALPHPDFECKVRYEAAGVAGCIVPWNYPLLMAAWKVAPALAAGCTVVLKPSELTPLTALELGEIANTAKLPAGVLNIVPGLGATAGQALAEHKDIAKIAFTGSVATGGRIMHTAANDIKNITLELGGKSPILVFDDCDVEQAVEWVLFGIFWNKGEVCSATSRLLVQKNIAHALLVRLKEEAQKIVIGNPMSDGVLLGPLVSKTQYEKVLGFIEAAKTSGAELLCGGKRPAHLEKGFFLEPTIFTNVPSNSRIWQEEIFGPVLCVNTFETEAEAIELANDSNFGLAAAVLSGNTETLQRVGEQLEAGIVWLNCSQPTFTEAPWGGRKQSGIGRELGPWGLDNYLEVKQITRYTSNKPWGWYLR